MENYFKNISSLKKHSIKRFYKLIFVSTINQSNVSLIEKKPMEQFQISQTWKSLIVNREWIIMIITSCQYSEIFVPLTISI